MEPETGFINDAINLAKNGHDTQADKDILKKVQSPKIANNN